MENVLKFYGIIPANLLPFKTDYSVKVNDRLYPLVRVFYAQPFVDMHNRMKEALAILGRIEGAVVRPPLQPIAEDERDQIRRALIQAGLMTA